MGEGWRSDGGGMEEGWRRDGRGMREVWERVGRGLGKDGEQGRDAGRIRDRGGEEGVESTME